MFTETEIPELKPLSERQKQFVLTLPTVDWNYSEAARIAYRHPPKTWEVNNWNKLRSIKVQAAITAIKRKLSEKSTAEQKWTFEESREYGYKLLAQLETELRKADLKPSERANLIRVSREVKENLDKMHAYLTDRSRVDINGSLEVSEPKSELKSRIAKIVAGQVAGNPALN